jgi:hypothetical protein
VNDASSPFLCPVFDDHHTLLSQTPIETCEPGEIGDFNFASNPLPNQWPTSLEPLDDSYLAVNPLSYECLDNFSFDNPLGCETVPNLPTVPTADQTNNPSLDKWLDDFSFNSLPGYDAFLNLSTVLAADSTSEFGSTDLPRYATEYSSQSPASQVLTQSTETSPRVCTSGIRVNGISLDSSPASTSTPV